MEVIASGAFGLVAGTLAGFLGVGGGAVLAPLLGFALGIDQHRAQGISLAALLPPVGLPAVLAYRRAGVRILPRLVLGLVIGFASGAYVGAFVAHRIPARELRWGFAVFLLVSAWLALARLRRPAAASCADAPGLPSPWLGLPIGVASGAMSGLLGIGGALVAIPLLRRLARLGRLEAQATTLAMMLPPIGLPAVYVYAREQGGLPWALLLAVMAGFAAGAGLGARLAGRVNERLATYLCAGFIGLLAVALVTRR